MNDQSLNPISFFTDAALSLIACFCGSYFVFSLFSAEKTVIITASIGAAFALSSLWLIFLGKLNSGRKKNYSAYSDFFIHRTTAENTLFTYRALSRRYPCALSGEVIACDKCDVLVRLRYAPLSVQEAIDLSAGISRKTLLIVNACEKNVEVHAKKAGGLLKIITFAQFAEWLDKLSALPKLAPKPPFKTRLKRTVKEFLSPENSSRFFSCGTVIAVFSILTGFKPYYAAFALTLFSLALFTKLRGIREREKR